MSGHPADNTDTSSGLTHQSALEVAREPEPLILHIYNVKHWPLRRGDRALCGHAFNGRSANTNPDGRPWRVMARRGYEHCVVCVELDADA